MSAIHLQFKQRPASGMALLKALLLPRKGFDAAVGLPDLHAHWHGASANPQALLDYCTALDITPGEALPIAYPHVMAGTMHMQMLSHGAFPIRLLGALHLKNRFVQYRPVGCNEVASIQAQFGGYRLVEKGVEFDLVTEFTIADELVWQETSIFFVRGRFGGADNPSTETSFELPGLPDTEVLHSWHIPANRGRQYARISGDYNPIHMSTIAAKMFGFERDIAHGFGVLAQALDNSKRLSDFATGEQPIQVDVIFKGPVFLESDVTIRHNLEQSTDRFDVYCDTNSRPSLCVAINKV